MKISNSMPVINSVPSRKVSKSNDWFEMILALLAVALLLVVPNV